MHESICSWPSQEFYEGKLLSHSSVGARDGVEGFPWPRGSALAFVHIKGVEQVSGTRSWSNHVEAILATAVVKRLVNAGSVGTGDIGVITPYDAQTTLIQSMLRRESLEDVEAANIDGFQGREHEVIVLSLLRGPTRTAGSVMLMMVAASTSHLHGQSALWSSLATRTL